MTILPNHACVTIYQYNVLEGIYFQKKTSHCFSIPSVGQCDVGRVVSQCETLRGNRSRGGRTSVGKLLRKMCVANIEVEDFLDPKTPPFWGKWFSDSVLNYLATFSKEWNLGAEKWEFGASNDYFTYFNCPVVWWLSQATSCGPGLNLNQHFKDCKWWLLMRLLNGEIFYHSNIQLDNVWPKGHGHMVFQGFQFRMCSI